MAHKIRRKVLVFVKRTIIPQVCVDYLFQSKSNRMITLHKVIIIYFYKYEIIVIGLTSDRELTSDIPCNGATQKLLYGIICDSIKD